MNKSFSFREIDWVLLGLALAIAVLGIIEVYSTTIHSPLAGQHRKQIYWVLLSLILALVVSQIDYRLALEQTAWLYVLSILMLAGLLVAGHSVGGVRRWLHLGGLTFQVSEAVKLVIIMAVAAYLAGRRTKFVTWVDLIKLGVLIGLPAVLVAREPDLGTAITFIPIVAVGVLLAGIRWQQIVALLLLGALALPVAWHF